MIIYTMRNLSHRVRLQAQKSSIALFEMVKHLAFRWRFCDNTKVSDEESGLNRTNTVNPGEIAAGHPEAKAMGSEDCGETVRTQRSHTGPNLSWDFTVPELSIASNGGSPLFEVVAASIEYGGLALELNSDMNQAVHHTESTSAKERKSHSPALRQFKAILYGS
ncbi:hypothetical protein AAFC00_002383 [Neodothiora populina]|uniref:Uncharacterized protein n=1 Tax=Neodothiora populina TaxID=2781224 RepID=A0ABR3PHA4_9PEZI